jgi:hypothetical protein
MMSFLSLKLPSLKLLENLTKSTHNKAIYGINP